MTNDRCQLITIAMNPSYLHNNNKMKNKPKCNHFQSINNIYNEPTTKFSRSSWYLTKMRSESHEFISAHDEFIYETRKTRSEILMNDNYLCQSISDLKLGDDEEEPIDYSVKYHETTKKLAEEDEEDEDDEEEDGDEFASNGIYAETDLDQPTDYSLRYAEDDSDSDILCEKHKDANEYLNDSVKTYCTEGTPYETPLNFSNATSMSDLRVDLDKKINKSEVKCSRLSEIADYNDEETTLFDVDEKCEEAKIDKSVNFAEETPLMFSRSSSLSSLNSLEQHSIEDQNSIVSDFSRLASGIVSPSEIPDSPTQSTFPSPKAKTNPDFINGVSDVYKKLPIINKQSTPPAKLSVFEDKLTKFVEESTPIEFSTNTSISNLTMMDEEPEDDDAEEDAVLLKLNMAPNSSTLDDDWFDEDDDDDILADCINIGQQSLRQPQQTQPSNHDDAIKQHSDSVKTYCTEGTPAGLSHAGSHTNLSAISSTNQKLKDEVSDEDDDDILAECIQLGMPTVKVKTKQITTCSRYVQTSPPPTTPPTITPSSSHQEDKKKVNVVLMDTKQRYLSARDEIEQFAVENSPCQFSLRSSLSDLTVDGSVAGLVRSLGEGESATTNQSASKPLTRSDSLSSLSENEMALLEECISDGMPKRKHDKQHESAPAATASTSTSSKQQCCACCKDHHHHHHQQHHHKSEAHESKRMQQKRQKMKDKTRQVGAASSTVTNQQSQQQQSQQQQRLITGQILAYRRDLLERSKEEWL